MRRSRSPRYILAVSSLAFVSVLVALSAAPAFVKTDAGRPRVFAPALRIGLFPFRQSGPLSDKLMASLTGAVRSQLEGASIAEIVPLAWPEDLATSDDPTFETLVNRGREEGCNGVLALHLKTLSFTSKTVKVPFAGEVQVADAAVGIGGGLIDVATGAAVAPVNVDVKQRNPAYGGESPEMALDSEFGQATFDDSLLGQATQQAMRQVVDAVRTGSAGLTPGPVETPKRARTPEGVGFGRDSYSMKMAVGYDLRGSVSVVNRGHEPQTFMVAALEATEGLAVGSLGEGSTDSPFTLGPGQWKEVRFVANAPAPTTSRAVRLGLFVAPAGAAPSPQGPPADQAVMNLHWEESSAEDVEWTVLEQDPVTLAYTCRMKNNGRGDVWDVAVTPAAEHAGLVRLLPSMEHVHIPPRGTVTFQVIPLLRPALRTMDVVLTSAPNGNRINRTFQFTVPDGKRVYMGMGHTSDSSSSAASGCTNAGELDLTDPYKAPPLTWRERQTLFLNRTWVWVIDRVDPDWRTRPPEYRERAVDVRGATIRPSVSARLALMETDSMTHPMASAGKECRGFVFYQPGPDKITTVYAVAERPSGGRISDLDEVVQVSEAGHTARWPYIRTRWSTSQAHIVWEDASPGQKSDVAFRVSTAAMKGWNPVQYLTRHGRGVDDPVVRVDDTGRVGVVWSDLRDGAGQIYFRLSRDGGQTFGPERAIPRLPGESQAWPQFDFAPRARFVLVYASKVSGQSQIVVRELDEQGIADGATTALSNAGAPAGEPQVACDSAGRTYSVWREGEGAASEVWFSRRPVAGATWTSPKPLTKDAVYSEYPLIWVEEETLFASYHTEAVGATDLKYVFISKDGGDTWGDRIAQPSLETDAADRAWVEVRFALQNPRSTYPPYDTKVFVNDVQVGEIIQRIPEGTYVWEVPVRILQVGAQGMAGNGIRLKTENLNGGHFILATESRLIVRRRYTQVPVVAGSQAEADALAARSGPGLNHASPDLALAANDMPALPQLTVPGRKIDLRLQVLNLGEAAATDTRVSLYSEDPREPLANLKTAKLAEVTVGVVQPGEKKAASLAFTYDPARTPRVYAAVTSKEKDFNTIDNTWGLSFVKGESNLVSPLFGTDIPDVLRAPGLLDVVSIRNPQGLADFLSMPGLDKLVGKPGLRVPDFGQVGSALRDKVNKTGIPRAPDPATSRQAGDGGVQRR